MKKSKKKNKKLNKFQSFFDYKCFFYDFVKVTGFIPAMLLFRFKYHFINKEIKKEFKKQPCIIVANHQSFLDPFVMVRAYYYKRVGLVATKDLFNSKFKSWLFKSFGCIYVDKDNVSMKTFKDVNERILRGHSVGIFPEGTVIHKDDNFDAFKSGAIMMAFMAKTCIYPTYTVKRKHWWNRQHILIGDKFDVKEYIKTPMPSIAQIEEVTKKLEQATKELERLSKEL
jgi:1-acyl-sn-glycerol-3-phosphate acyltransferase